MAAGIEADLALGRSADLAALLHESRALLEQQQFRLAAINYRILLHEPALPADPQAQREVLSNLGTALLGQQETNGPNGARFLAEAIKLLTRARNLHRRHDIASSPALDTGLALAHYRLYRHTGNRGHLMAAHIALDDSSMTADFPRSVAVMRRLLRRAGRRRA